MVENVTLLLSILTVVAQIFIFFAIVELIRTRGKKKNSMILRLVDRTPVLYSFFIAALAMLGSLFYSEIAQYDPCEFCWYQRILMYPLVVLFGLALLRRDRNILPYGFILSIIGAIIALYHYLMQLGFIAPTTCSAVGVSVSCSDSFTVTFGYISIPMMALTAFALIIIFSVISQKND
ncbi:MAG: disulfide oxidoreductase [Candidatus Campbellbacteria bacterium]|nr:disulfide oxidoreductase [Candidatus Campbellbacteria bacterium]